MCGYDPWAWYDEMLDREHEAYMHGYDTYKEYREAELDDVGNRQYDSIKDERSMNNG